MTRKRKLHNKPTYTGLKKFNKSYAHIIYNLVISGDINGALNKVLNDIRNTERYLVYQHIPKVLQDIYNALVDIPVSPTEHDYEVFAAAMVDTQDNLLGGIKRIYNGKDLVCTR